MINMYSVSYNKKINYQLPVGTWIKEINAGALKDGNSISLTDNTSDNISHLNRWFGELTAQYWVWKNTFNNKPVGFCHYRRYFNFKIYSTYHLPKIYMEPTPSNLQILDSLDQEAAAIRLLKTYDILTTRPYFLNQNIRNQYCENHPTRTWEAFIDSIMINSPEWVKENIDFFEYSTEARFYPIYIMRWNDFDEWMTSLFSVLLPVFQEIGDIADIPGARFQPCRYPAYLAERYMMLYFFSKRLKTFGTQIITLEESC